MSRFGRSGVFAMVIALAAGACGTGERATTVVGGSAEATTTVAGAAVPDGELAFGLVRCEFDSSMPSADRSSYRDAPIYVGNEQPMEEVRAWASTQAAFEEIWIDRDRNGWISVGFSENAAARQSDLEAKFPDVGVVAIDLAVTNAELESLRSQVEAALDGLPSWGLGHSAIRGRVEVDVPVLDEQTLRRLEPFAGSTLCVSGMDPAAAVVDGPQPVVGEGWRLLGTDRTGSTYRTGVATNGKQYEEVWAEAGLSGERPAVDFDAEIVIWFGAVYGSSCPIRMDEVVIDRERHMVHADFVLPGNPTSCTGDANPEAYVVAVSRDRLPEAPFAVQLDADDPPSGAPEERTTVEVDLRAAGSIASADQLVVDTWDEGGHRGAVRFRPGQAIEAGYPWMFLVDLACSVDILGPLNGISWLATDESLLDGPPPEWMADANDGFALAEFLLTTGPAHLTVTINGMSKDYEPIPAGDDGDMSCS